MNAKGAGFNLWIPARYGDTGTWMCIIKSIKGDVTQCYNIHPDKKTCQKHCDAKNAIDRMIKIAQERE